MEEGRGVFVRFGYNVRVIKHPSFDESMAAAHRRTASRTPIADTATQSVYPNESHQEGNYCSEEFSRPTLTLSQLIHFLTVRHIDLLATFAVHKKKLAGDVVGMGSTMLSNCRCILTHKI